MALFGPPSRFSRWAMYCEGHYRKRRSLRCRCLDGGSGSHLAPADSLSPSGRCVWRPQSALLPGVCFLGLSVPRINFDRLSGADDVWSDPKVNTAEVYFPSLRSARAGLCDWPTVSVHPGAGNAAGRCPRPYRRSGGFVWRVWVHRRAETETADSRTTHGNVKPGKHWPSGGSV